MHKKLEKYKFIFILICMIGSQALSIKNLIFSTLNFLFIRRLFIMFFENHLNYHQKEL